MIHGSASPTRSRFHISWIFLFSSCSVRVQCCSLLAHVTSLESIYQTSCGSIWSQGTLCPTFFDVWNRVRIHVVLLRVSRTRRQAWLHFYQLGSCPEVNQLYVFQLEPRHDKGKHLSKDGGRSGYCACKENVGFASLHSAIKVTNKRPLFLPTASFFPVILPPFLSFSNTKSREKGIRTFAAAFYSAPRNYNKLAL